MANSTSAEVKHSNTTESKPIQQKVDAPQSNWPPPPRKHALVAPHMRKNAPFYCDAQSTVRHTILPPECFKKKLAPSVQRNAQRDADVEATIDKSRRRLLESPEVKQLRSSIRERNQREAEAEEAARQKAEQKAEQAKLLEECQRKEAEQKAEQAKLLEEHQKNEAEGAAAAEKAILELELNDSGLEPDPGYERKQYLIRPLDAEWDEKVTQAMQTKNRDKALAKSVGGTDLTRANFGTLLPQSGTADHSSGWLNDEIVNAFIDAIAARKLEKDEHVRGRDIPSFVAMNSHWCNHFKTHKGIHGIETWAKRRGIQGDKLLRCRKIFFPINTGLHWMLLIISPRERTIEILDSLRGSNKVWTKRAREFLEMELGGKYVPEEWEELGSKSEVQSNENDCGVFAAFNALAAAKEVPFHLLTVNGGTMRDARKIMAAVLLNGGLKGEWEL